MFCKYLKDVKSNKIKFDLSALLYGRPLRYLSLPNPGSLARIEPGTYQTAGMQVCYRYTWLRNTPTRRQHAPYRIHKTEQVLTVRGYLL
jgi:hypothetical protein